MHNSSSGKYNMALAPAVRTAPARLILQAVAIGLRLSYFWGLSLQQEYHQPPENPAWKRVL